MLVKLLLSTACLLLLLLAFEPIQCQADEKDPKRPPAERPFPNLFYNTHGALSTDSRRVKIVSEVIASDFRRNNEEIIDLEMGRAAFVQFETSLNWDQMSIKDTRQEVLLSIAESNRIFKYWPYTCITQFMDTKALYGLDYYSSDTYEESYGQNSHTKKPKVLRIFGLAALWMQASTAPKTHTQSAQIYSAGKDIYRRAEQWTFDDPEEKITVTFSFMSSTFNAKSQKEADNMEVSSELTLEVVKIFAQGTDKLIRTINVISIDYDVPLEALEHVLEVPVGYGCKPGLASDADHPDEDLSDNDDDGKLANDNDFWSKYMWDSSLVELEVTATKIDPSTHERSTDTIYAELAHIPMLGNEEHFDLMMTKIKSKKKETKSIVNRLFNVKYQIDLQRGTCRMDHLTSDTDESESDLLLEFSNGLKLSLERDQIEMLFTSEKGKFHLIKRVEPKSGKQLSRIYLERTLDGWPYADQEDQIAREIRTYATEFAVDVKGGDTSTADVRVKQYLEGITIWVLDAKSQSRIEAIYHIHVVNEEFPLSDWPDIPRLFDVSQECYLDNDKMRSGQDYAWVEFMYPASSRQLDLMVQSEYQLKRSIYLSFVIKYGLTSFRLPRLELMFGDEGLVVRALMLDLPPLEVLYDLYEGQKVIVYEDRGDLKFVVPDTRHCTKLCQLHSCKSMSFCLGTRECSLGMLPINPKATQMSEKQVNVPNRACTAYSLPMDRVEFMKSGFQWKRLANLLSLIQHQDYDLSELPKMPEELTLPRDESGLESDEEYRKVYSKYLTDVTEYMSQSYDKKILLILNLNINNHPTFLSPSRFTVENNPLENFNIPGGQVVGDSSDTILQEDSILHDTTQVVSFFHEGLAMSRFKYGAYSRLLNGLSYDQCALGCLDSRCGTFSYCPSRRECILTEFDELRGPKDHNFIEEDNECFISQRDFTKNFQRFPNVPKPKNVSVSMEVASVSDCALQCIRNEHFKCMSFEFCEKFKGENDKKVSVPSDLMTVCYIQRDRHPAELFNENPMIIATSNHSDNAHSSNNDNQVRVASKSHCDHYERSFLAEFNHIESRKVADEMLAKLKTSEYSGLTVFECANVCLNELADCSAFQFCFTPSLNKKFTDMDSNKYNYMQTCVMIQSKPEQTEDQKEFEVLIDQQQGDKLARASKYLDNSDNCQVYALRPDTIQSHLRDLAMGQTMTVEERRELEQASASSGVTLSWFKYIMLFLSVTIGSASLAVGVCWARERHPFVRDQIDRARYFVGL